MKILFTIFTLILLSGCSMTQAPKSEYIVNTKMIEKSLDATMCSAKSLKIGQAFSSGSLKSLKMNYVLGNEKQFAYSQSQWANSPSNAISSEIIALLRSTKLFKNVQVSKSRTRNDLLLETNIEEFVQYFNEERSESFSRVRISFTLVETKSNKVLSTDSFSSKVDAKELNAAGGVKALNVALSNVLNESRVWFESVCK